MPTHTTIGYLPFANNDGDNVVFVAEHGASAVEAAARS